MSSGRRVFRIQNAWRSASSKTNNNPSTSPSESRNMSPRARVSGVSATPTARRAPDGKTTWARGTSQSAASSATGFRLWALGFGLEDRCRPRELARWKLAVAGEHPFVREPCVKLTPVVIRRSSTGEVRQLAGRPGRSGERRRAAGGGRGASAGDAARARCGRSWRRCVAARSQTERVACCACSKAVRTRASWSRRSAHSRHSKPTSAWLQLLWRAACSTASAAATSSTG